MDPRVWNLLRSLPPLALLIKYNFEQVKYTREASKVEWSDFILLQGGAGALATFLQVKGISPV